MFSSVEYVPPSWVPKQFFSKEEDISPTVLSVVSRQQEWQLLWKAFCVVLLCNRLLAVRGAADTRVVAAVGEGGWGWGQWKVTGTLWGRHTWSGRALTPFELLRAPSPPGRLRGGAVRAETAGCCSRLSWKAGTPCCECWTPPCPWASQELWSWSSDRSGDKGGWEIMRRRWGWGFGVSLPAAYQISQQ